MAKSRNNLLGVGGQRKKLSRNDAQGAAANSAADRRTAADQKQDLLRKMRERALGESGENGESGESGESGETSATGETRRASGADS